MATPANDPDDATASASADVLVVDDNEVNLSLGKRLVQRFGFTATMARSVRGALAKTSEHAFRLVLMDCQMPDIDGIEATRQIRLRESAGHRRTPIVGLSASAESSVRRACMDAGMDDFLDKPIDVGALNAVPQRWLDEPTSASRFVSVVARRAAAVSKTMVRSMSIRATGASSLAAFAGEAPPRGRSSHGGRALRCPGLRLKTIQQLLNSSSDCARSVMRRYRRAAIGRGSRVLGCSRARVCRTVPGLSLIHI